MFIRHHHNSIRHHQGDNTKDAIARDVGGCRYSSCDWSEHGILYRDRNTPIRPVSPSNYQGPSNSFPRTSNPPGNQLYKTTAFYLCRCPNLSSRNIPTYPSDISVHLRSI